MAERGGGGSGGSGGGAGAGGGEGDAGAAERYNNEIRYDEEFPSVPALAVKMHEAFVRAREQSVAALPLAFTLRSASRRKRPFGLRPSPRPRTFASMFSCQGGTPR